MKSTLLSLLIVAAVLISSCKKHTSGSPYTGGNWTIKNNTYNADSCVYYSSGPSLPASMVAQTVLSNTNPNGYSQLSFILGAPPLTTTTYTLVNDSIFGNINLDSTQAYVSVTVGVLPNQSADYVTTGTGTMTVTVSSTGKISISAPSGIEVKNLINYSDSAKLIINVAQTN